ncbi:hypothetical protein E8E12_004053, partial [Didymella heteroderae]
GIEPLPNAFGGMQTYTRRMRRPSDPPPRNIKGWDHWVRYCDIYGIPYDFLNEEQVRIMRIGLPRIADGPICAPPQYPLYPEPSACGSCVLAPTACSARLPRKFQQVASVGGARAGRKRSAGSLGNDQNDPERVVVEPDGNLSVVAREDCSPYPRAGKRYRWSYLPWTMEMEKSC